MWSIQSHTFGGFAGVLCQFGCSRCGGAGVPVPVSWPRSGAWPDLASLRGDVSAMHVLRSIAHAVDGAGSPSRWSDDQLVGEVSRWLERGVVRLCRETPLAIEPQAVDAALLPRASGPAPRAARTAAAARGARPPLAAGPVVRHWVEVQLVDEDDRPVVGELCKLVTPDADVLYLDTDTRGLVRWEGRTGGRARASFPNLDGARWKAVSPPRADHAVRNHTVRQGECLSRIAFRHGFDDWRVVYDHPCNEELRRRRPDPDVLHPGDVVAIPPLDTLPEACDLDRRHRFVLRHPLRRLAVVMLDEHKAPIANQACTAETDDGLLLFGVTDDDGLLSLELPMETARLELWIAGMRRTLQLGHLNPLERVDDDGGSGVQGRLCALGFDPGPVDGRVGPRTRAALVAFQRHYRLPRTGHADAATLQRLAEECRA